MIAHTQHTAPLPAALVESRTSASFVVKDSSGQECGCYCGEIKIFAGGEGESDALSSAFLNAML
jgi:hypothetical protein